MPVVDLYLNFNLLRVDFSLLVFFKHILSEESCYITAFTDIDVASPTEIVIFVFNSIVIATFTFLEIVVSGFPFDSLLWFLGFQYMTVWACKVKMNHLLWVVIYTNWTIIFFLVNLLRLLRLLTSAWLALLIYLLAYNFLLIS